jgi:hypothetical protein
MLEGNVERSGFRRRRKVHTAITELVRAANHESDYQQSINKEEKRTKSAKGNNAEDASERAV